MSIQVGQFGVPFRLSTNGLDMSSFTKFTLNFTDPNGLALQKTELTTNAVSAPAVALVNDPDLGNQSASTYFELITLVTDFTVAGTWSVCGFAEDATRGLPTIEDYTFEVLEACT